MALVQLPRALTLIAWLAVFPAACTRVESAKPPPEVPVGADGFGGGDDGGSGGISNQGGAGEGGTMMEQGGAPSAIELGIWPTFTPEGAKATDAEAVLAATGALSAGSDVLPIYERWDALSGSTGSPRAVTWQRLEAMVAPYRDRRKSLALCIGIVDRTSRAWPFAADLDEDAAVAAMRSTIDEVLKRYAQQLSHLCFGYEVDRYLAQASAVDRGHLLEFLRQAIDYAALHPERAQSTALGVAVTLEGASDSALIAELALGDEVVAVYDPLDHALDLKPPTAIVDELDAALAALATLDGGAKPLALFDAGYPSGEGAGSSEEQQQSYYDALFEALEAHSTELSFVGFFGLGDRAASECEAEAMSYGSAAPERALARCSVGLLAEGDTPKLAWPGVLQALSRYR